MHANDRPALCSRPALARDRESGLADDVADFYRGKTITVVNGGGSGGGSVVYTQVIAPLLQKHMPGNPNVVIQYMPGAGGARAANYVYAAAPKDGTVLGRPLQEVAFFALLGAPGLMYDAARFQYIGGAFTARSTISVMKEHTGPHDRGREAHRSASSRPAARHRKLTCIRRWPMRWSEPSSSW